jgi:hypothetical protein
MMPQKLSAFRECKLRFDASKAVRFSRIRHCLIASLPQNRVRFSRPVKENQGLTIVAKAKKTLSAYWLPRKEEEGERGDDTPVATRETWGSGTASPHPSHEWGRCCRAPVLDTLRIIIIGEPSGSSSSDRTRSQETGNRHRKGSSGMLPTTVARRKDAGIKARS